MDIQFRFVTKAMFLDRPGLVDRMDKKTRKVLAFTGKRTMTYMQRNMRYRNKPGPVGGFPSAHRDGPPFLRQFIRFGFDVPNTSLIVGPVLLPRSDKNVRASGNTVPRLVNEGGTVKRPLAWSRKQNKFVRIKRIITHRYRPRPFVKLTTPYAGKEMARLMAEIAL